MPETIKLIGSNKSKITKDNFENNEVVLVHCNIVNNNYQENSIPLHTFIPNK